MMQHPDMLQGNNTMLMNPDMDNGQNGAYGMAN